MYQPLQLLNNYTEKSDISWQELDLVRMLYRRQHKLPDWLYLTNNEAFYAFRCKGIITQEETDQNFKSQIMFISYMLSVLASWRISKQVYHFEPEMEELLYSQASEELLLPVEVLKNMPYSCIYFEAPNLYENQFHRFFACFDIIVDMKLLKFVILHHDGEAVDIHSIELKSGQTLKECMTTLLKIQYSSQDVDKELDYSLIVVKKMLQLVLYVCAENADIQNADPGRNTAKPKAIRNIKDKYREISRWDVGNNVIKRIRNHKKAHNTTASAETDKEENNDQTTSPIERHYVTPHVRRGHWQSYWVGKKDGSEERRLVLRWKHFIYVNADGPDALPVTINCIQK